MSKRNVAFITGITGQDGSYLAEFLLEKGYEVHGMVRRSSSFNRERIEHLMPDIHGKNSRIHTHYGDLSDATSIHSLIRQIKPTEIYHLGAQSHVRVSFDIPEYTADVTGLSTLRLLEAIRHEDPTIKFYQASSSEMFGSSNPPQDENTAFQPRSPYAAAKVFAYWMVVNYRDGYDLHASNGILFNHESPRRGKNFVTRKITNSFAQILAGSRESLFLGNLDAKRDWGFAPDYVEMMWMILQQEQADDYVAATGESHTVREFVEEVCRLLDYDLQWEGSGLDEKGIDKKSGKTLIQIDERYFRPTEVDHLEGSNTKAQDALGWKPRTSFSQLTKIMLEADLRAHGLDKEADSLK